LLDIHHDDSPDEDGLSKISIGNFNSSSSFTDMSSISDMKTNMTTNNPISQASGNEYMRRISILHQTNLTPGIIGKKPSIKITPPPLPPPLP
jgi:hypothetical protein